MSIKLNITIGNGWLEATWYDEVDDNKTQVHCESFSGHPEHIEALRKKAVIFGTSLADYEDGIAQCIEAFVMPTAEELAAVEVKYKVDEYKAYLNATDFKMTVDYYATLTVEEQNELVAKRSEAREYIRLNEVKV